MSFVQNSSILEIPQFFFGYLVVAMVTVIISVIDGLAEWTLYDWLLRLSDYRCPVTANCHLLWCRKL